MYIKQYTEVIDQIQKEPNHITVIVDLSASNRFYDLSRWAEEKINKSNHFTQFIYEQVWKSLFRALFYLSTSRDDPKIPFYQFHSPPSPKDPDLINSTSVSCLILLPLRAMNS